MTCDFRIPAPEIARRIEQIQYRLQNSDIDALFIIQRVDLLYYSGTAQRGYLFIPSEGKPLLLIKRYLPRAMEESPLGQIVRIESIKEAPQRIRDFYGVFPEKIGLELDVMPVREYRFIKNIFKEQTVLDASDLILSQRMIKSAWEVEQTEKTGELSCSCFEYARNNMREGLSEMEFAGMLEAYARNLGHGGMMRVRDYHTEGYAWHILSGKSGGMIGLLDSPSSGEGTSTAFPCGAGYRPFAQGDPVMIDFNSVLNGYHFDETRMLSIGKMPQRAMDACLASIEIHNEVLENVRAGITVDELFQISVKKANSLGYKDYYLGPSDYRVTFIGHGIGMELIEKPIIAEGRRDILQPGMVFALEPKMTFLDEFAAGIESVFLVTENGHKMISKTPVEIFTC